MKRMTVGLAALVFACACIGTVAAAAHDGGHGSGRWERGFGMGRLLHRLDLTQDQKRQVASILESHRGEIGNVATRLVQATENLLNATAAEPFSEDAVKQAAQAVADQQEQLIALRAGIFNEIKPILTPEQLTTLAQMRGKMAERMKNHVDVKLAALDKWIARHGK
jgi:periplasmic protein CpxP/Spy